MKTHHFHYLIYTVLILLLFISCTPSENDQDKMERATPGMNIVSTDLFELQSVIAGDSKSLIFITTNWCRGGALTLNSFVYPKLQNFVDQDVQYYIIYFGEELREDIISDSLGMDRPVTIHQIDNNLFDKAFVHKYRIKSFLKDLDPTYKFSYAIPVSVVYENGELRDVVPAGLDALLRDHVSHEI